MKLWRWLLVLLVLAALAAFGWHWIAADPGQVIIRVRGWRVETSVLVVVLVLIALWLVLDLLWRLLRWPFRAVRRRRERVAHKRFSGGLVDLLDGRHVRAEKRLHKAARLPALETPARLLEGDAARRQGAWERALEHFAAIDGKGAQQAALVQQARVLREHGEPARAAQLLEEGAAGGRLPAAGWHEMVRARLAAGDALGALAGLEPLRKSGALGADAQRALEKDVLLAALAASDDAPQLADIWRRLPGAQRRDTALVSAFVRQAAGSGAALAALDEVRASLRREWQPELAALYLELDTEPAEKRLRRGEKWLQEHADDPVLLVAVGRLCAELGIDGKARQYLQHALEIDPQRAAAWTALGDVARHDGQDALAAHCYRNALGIAGGGEPDAVMPATREVAATTVVEARDQHGVPQLRHADLAPEDEGA